MSPISISIISLPSATERRQKMLSQICDLNIPFEFFDAMPGPTAELILHENKWPALNGRTLKNSELGCYASHYSLLERHSKSTSPAILIILEDDAVIDTTYFKETTAFINLVNRFQYIRFNGQLIAPSSEVHIQGRRRVIRFRKKVHGTLGYAITVEAAQKFRAALQNVYRPIDIEMDRFWSHGIPILCLYQPIALERSEPTSIGDRGFGISGTTWLFWKINNQIEKIRCFSANILYDLKIWKI